MRRIIYVFCIIAFASLSILSCTSDEYDDGCTQETPELNIPEKYKIIGERHNEGLEAAFTAIRNFYEQPKTKSNKTKLTKDEYLTIAQKGLKNYCNEQFGEYPELISHQTDIKTRAQSEIENPRMAAFINKIKDVLDNEPKNSTQLVAALNQINEEATRELSEIEATAVYAGTSTCYNSYMYWKENHMKWILILNKPNMVNKFSDEELNLFTIKNKKLMAPAQTRGGWWDDAWSSAGEAWDSTTDYVSDWWNEGGGKEVVADDAGSAVAGAIGGAIAGSSVGGVGSIPGAITGGVGAGAAGSISSAVEQWILGL